VTRLVPAVVGFIVGAVLTLALVRSDTSGLLVGRTQVVEDLERRLHEVELQREQLGRQLEDASARAARMEASFNELERRFRALGGDQPR
jgi:hypothetical protein